MKEKDFVTIINNSIYAFGGFSHKISDSPFIPGNEKMRFTKKKPFDIIACLDGDAFYIEVKYKRGICGFSDTILSSHQKENLILINDNRCKNDNIYPVLFYICYIPRKIKRLYIFHIEYLIENKISKVQLENNFPFLTIKPTEYNKRDRKTGIIKPVKENLFDAKRMKDIIIWRKQ